MNFKIHSSAFSIILCILLPGFVFAGKEIKYKVADIPAQLLLNAKAVIRSEENVVNVQSDEKVVQKVKIAITILNKNGELNANFMQPYTSKMKVSNIKAHMYDENGIEIKKKDGFQVLDYALISDGTTYNDNRIKAILPEHYTYPYTMEYTYEISFSDVMQFPGWHPVSDFNISVEKSSYSLIISKKANCRFYELNITDKVRVHDSIETISYKWDLNNFQAFDNEKFCPALSDISPVVLIAPTKVNVEGFMGTFDTWKDFGLWIYKLNWGKNNLSEETKAKIRKMTEGITDDRKKIKILYEYLQNKTRYVSVQIGLGGFQPFSAETVDRLSYGDCKALSNYMQSLLEVAGINSLYTLALAGSENPTVHADFPCNQFNHAILCVPLQNDTVWLECTSQRNPFNYMGTFTADRNVLAVDGNGGKLIKTPALKNESNLASRNVKVILDQSGNGAAEVTTVYHGATYDNYAQILYSDQVDQKKLIIDKIQIPNFELDDFKIKENKSEQPSVTENLSLSIINYCPKNGEKLILCLNMMNKLAESPFLSDKRKTPVSIKWPVYEIDTVVYRLPQGYTLENMPAKVIIDSDFGQYTTEVTKTGNMLQYIRSFKIYKGLYPVNRYEEIAAFFEKIVTTDENKVLLTKTL